LVDPIDFGFDVVVDDGPLGHADQEVLDVHDLEGQPVLGLLDDRHVAQLPPTLYFVLLLHFDQSVLQPEV